MEIKPKDIPAEGSSVYDDIGRIVFMAYADKYVLCRRPGCIPFVMGIERWVELKKEIIESSTDS